MNEDMKKEIESIIGLRIDFKNGIRFIKIQNGITLKGLEKLLIILREYKNPFSLFDGLYPSPSDPGAYIDYSQVKNESEECWSMTLGNHGWTGGMYHIGNSIIANQLHNLYKKGLLTEIQIDKTIFSSLCNVVEIESNAEENMKISNLHTETAK